MIYIHDNKEEKQLSVFLFNDEIGFTRDNPYVKEQIQFFVDRGYQVHQYIYPEVHNLPDKVQELYNSMYSNKALLERISDSGVNNFLENATVQAVKQEISKFTLEDFIEAVAWYVTHNNSIK